jgi:saccharopine dehydrogenase (NAD+, L-lysine-forming)
MNKQVGIRREDKNVWERRVPITPQHVTSLTQQAGLSFCVQSSGIRAFSDEDYRAAGAEVRDDVSACPVVFAVKEIPLDLFQPNGTYVFFAHVIKGQAYNMPMLKRMLELGCTLIDYEKVTDDKGRRLIFFGRHAGLAGMIDTLWALGQRLEWERTLTPFSQIQQTYHYGDLAAAKEAVKGVGEGIATAGLPDSLVPFVCGFAGYGNVSRGAQEIYDQLPVVEIAPEELLTLTEADRHAVYKVVFKEVHTVKPLDPAKPFDLAHFFKNPAEYESQFEPYIPHLTVLVNAIYWSPVSPRLVTKAYLRELYRPGYQAVKLKVIGDISCDIEGAIEATVRSTEPDEPVFVYEPLTGETPDGVRGNGPVIMAVDNLPCELPAESSADFSATLRDFVPAIATADYSVPFDQLALPPEIKRAVIAYQGKLTPDYRYLEKHLRE